MESAPAALIEEEADKHWQRWTAGPADEEGNKALFFAVDFYKQAAKNYERDEQHLQFEAVLVKLIPALLAFESRYEAIKAFEAIADCLAVKQLVTDVDRYLQLFSSSSSLYVEEQVENLFIAKVRQTADRLLSLGNHEAPLKLLSLIRQLLPGDERETSRPQAMFALVSALVEEEDFRGALTVIDEEIRRPVSRPHVYRFFIDKLMIAVVQEDSHGAERIYEEVCLG